MLQGPADLNVQPLSHLALGQDWRVQLAHDRPAHLLIWITRGQGRALLDGRRRGLGAHNALWIPAGCLFAIDLGRSGAGHAVSIPAGGPLRLPEMPRHLRIRDTAEQTALSTLVEAAHREAETAAPLWRDAMEAHGTLISVWLRRQIMLNEHVPEPRKAAARLSQRFCDLLAQRYATGDPMSAYAMTLGVTPTHLTRAVKAATGKTAADLITERVLHAARSLLSDTKAPAAQIARHLGFGSAAYFTRFMTRHAGQPPSKLRA